MIDEIIADLMDACRVFCNSQTDCKTCPLRQMELDHEFSCIRAYAQYLLDGKGDDKNE